MNQYRFQTIGKYAEYKRRLRHTRRFWALMTFAFLPMAVQFGMRQYAKSHLKLTAVPASSSIPSFSTGGSGSTMVCFDPNHPTIDRTTGINWLQADKDLDYATRSWRVALNDDSIKKPKLSPGSCGVSSALACVANGGKWNEIFLTDVLGESENKKTDLKSVLMHEMGHLLGVPHIEGDPLMDPQYQGKLDRPSNLAVVIAKALRK